MNLAPDPERRGGLSRREFVQGRFWRAIGFGPTRQAKRPMVTRYPKSLGDPVSGTTETAQEPAGWTPPNDRTSRRHGIPVLRPPGAIEEVGFLAGCTRCDDCVKACPYEAITHAPAQLREAVGTPMIDADRQPCLMCQDFPCIAACQPGVLSSVAEKVMGTARITEHLCLAYHGTTCTVCSERCPVPHAITLTEGRSTVNETACTGCGVCRYVCPAPENAILLMPAFSRAP